MWLTPVSASLLRVLTALTALRAVRLEAYAINDITCCARPRGCGRPGRGPAPAPGHPAAGSRERFPSQGPDAAGVAAGYSSTA